MRIRLLSLIRLGITDMWPLLNRLVINQLNGSVKNIFIFINILIFFLAAGEKLKQPEKCERSNDRNVKTKSGKVFKF